MDRPDHRRFIPAADPALQYCGRVAWDGDGSSCRFDWPGTEVRLTTSGSAGIWLSMDGASNYFSLVCNQDAPTILVSGDGTQEYLVASGLDPTVETTFRLCKRTEAVAQFPDRRTGCVHLQGLLLDQGGRLVEMKNSGRRVIEFVGDSDTAAYGNLGMRTGFEVKDRSVFADPSKQNASQSWAAFVAEACAADCHNISYSGMGAVWNAPGHTARGAMDAHYPRLLVADFGRVETPGTDTLPEVDLVVLYIGGNDWWTLAERGDDAFVDGFVGFLQQVRGLRPWQPILVLTANDTSGSCLVTPARQRRFSEDMQRVLDRSVRGSGGESAGIYLREVVPEPPIDVRQDDDWGLMEHWSVKAHSKWARGVIPHIMEIAGWDAVTDL